MQPFPSLMASGRYQRRVAENRSGERSARELFYRDGGKMMVVDVTTQSGFHAAKPRMLFEGHYCG